MSGQTPDTQPAISWIDDLQDALAHLHDPCYQTPRALVNVMGTAHWDLVRDELVRAIETLAPPSDAPAGAPATRYYAILYSRYVQRQTQEVVAEQLGLSVRHLRRQQGDAVQWLAGRLQAPRLSTTADQAFSSASPWMAQVRQELEALREDAENATCMVGQLIEKVVALAEPLIATRGVKLRYQPAPAELMAGIHATSLRQVLLVTLDRMTTAKAPTGDPATVAISTRGDGDRVQIMLTISPTLTTERPFDYLVDEILSSRGGHAEWQVDDESARATLHLHAVRLCPVLVVDDNADLVHFYQRYTTGTPYRIIHKVDGADIIEAVRESGAEIIVLDVMLPDVDGWELLTHLHQHPATRHIPVLVCTVVRAEELATALGAAAYLAKPVRRAEFIETLHRLQPRRQAHASD